MTTLHSLSAASSDAWLNRLRIGPRLWLATAVPVALVCAFGAWLWLSLAVVREDVQSHLMEQVRMAQLAKDLALNVVEVQDALTDVSATRGLDGLDDGFAEAAKSRQAFLQGLQTFEDYLASHDAAHMHDTTRKLRSAFDLYYATGERTARAYVDGGPAAGNPLMPAFDEAAESLQSQMQALVDKASQDMKAEVTGVASDLGQLRLWGLMLAAAVTVLTLLAGWLIARSITRPLNQAVQATGRVAQGDLAFDIPVSGQDETADLLRSLRQMQSQLRDIASGVRRNAEQVAAASQQIADGNMDLSVRTEEQASALQETTASMMELGSTVGEATDSARQADEVAQGARAVVSRAGEVVEQMVQTMEGINQSSRKIADIIGVIDGIAFQTNILALNAAVEAARAGSQGRGFAVVAAEVRSLAQRSAEAAREISSLIRDSVGRVETGAGLVQQAGSTMQEVVASIERVTGLMGHITQATSRQREGIQQVGTAVQEIDNTTQQNAALVEESAAAAQSLRDQAQHLLELTAVFRLEGAVIDERSGRALALSA